MWKHILVQLPWLLLPLRLQAAPPGHRNLSDASLEELVEMEVSSVSRKDQKLARTPAAVYVITKEEIRRSGATRLPELLRMAPGLHVAQIDGNKWAVSARGFAGRLANKMLVLIDGRSIYNTLYSGVYWEQNDTLLEDIERIEVVRGPGGTMWGANAVNGVIHIITKHSKDTKGTLIGTTAGNVEHGGINLRHGGAVGQNLSYRAWARYFDRGGLWSDASRATRGGGRLDWQLNRRDSLMVEGDSFRGRADAMVYPDFPFSTRWAPDSVTNSGGFGLARFERRLSERSGFAFQTYFNSENHDEFQGRLELSTLDFDFQHRIGTFNRNDLMWGVGIRTYRSAAITTPDSFVRFPTRQRRDNLSNLFVQDDIELARDKLFLTLGVKALHNTFTGVELQPNVRLTYLPTARHSIWGAVSRAVRTPNWIERQARVEYIAANGVGLFLGREENGSQTVAAYEAGYRHQPHRMLSIDIAAFFNRYDHLRGTFMLQPFLQTGPPLRLVIPSVWALTLRGHTYGGEAAGTWTPSDKWKLSGSYSLLRYREEPNNSLRIPSAMELAFPERVVHLRSALDLRRGVTLDTSLYHVSRLRELGVAPFTRVDVRLGWQLHRNLELSVTGQNLLNGRHREFLSEDYTRSGEIRRAVLVKLLWAF